MSNMQSTSKDIKGIECKFVQFIPKDELIGRPDMHYVKEVIHYADGTLKPNLRMIKDYQRPFWITKEHCKVHKQKKEYEVLSKLNMYTSTQSDLAKNVQMRLNRGYRKVSHVREVAGSPYVYGLDIDAKHDIKYRYSKKYPEIESKNTVCGLDIEINIDTNEITIMTIAMDNKVYTAILKSILHSTYMVEEKLKNMFLKYIPDEKKDEYKVQYELFDTSVDMIKSVFKNIHEWKPDFLEAWNAPFDIGKIIETLENNKIDPKDIFSDPSVPEVCRYFNYRQSGKRLSASGVAKNTSLHEQWNYVICPASFFVIDGMCTYHFIRTTDKAVPGGYGLDNMLDFILGSSYKKLKFPGLDEKLEQVEGLALWHKIMLEKYPMEYIIYNQWDVLSMLKIDQKTMDLQLTITILSENSSLDMFASSPKRFFTNFHFFALEQGCVLGTKDPLLEDQQTLGIDDWIVMLPSNRITDEAFDIIEDCGNLATSLRSHVFDADQVSGYPSDTVAANISKDTTSKELLDVEGFEKEQFKLANMNLFYGSVNAVSYATEMFNFPTLEELDKMII